MKRPDAMYLSRRLEGNGEAFLNTYRSIGRHPLNMMYRKFLLVLFPLLLGAVSHDSGRPSFVDAMLELMLGFKMPKGSVEEGLDDRAKLARWRPLVEMTYEQCKRYAPKTRVKVETCAAIAINAVYWETGLQQRYQLEPKAGPSGEECWYQIHRSAEQIPFPDWKPLNEYGTRHGLDYTRCVEDGVRILSYHPWRCHLDESDLRGPDNRWGLMRLYVQYYLPNPECRVSTKRISADTFAILRRRATMARRIIERLPPDD